jgi:uncharacterized membrane protein YoaK (UPF0700 family)
MHVVPSWLHIVAIVMLFAGAVIAAVIIVDEIRHPQPMRIMNLVWPLCVLFGTLIVLVGGYWAPN